MLPIYIYGHEILKKKAKPVVDIADRQIKLIHDMLETMHEANGIGLAANQVGVLERVLVIDISDTEEGKETNPIIVVNPEIIGEEGEWAVEEGCLSIPEIREEIVRPQTVGVRFLDGNFKEREVEFSGLMGRVLLHEIDHLDGILFTDHLSAAKRTLLKSRLRKVSKGEFESKYPFVLGEEKKKRRAKK